MLRPWIFVPTLLLSLLAVLVGGCTPAGTAPTEPVSGLVTCRGQPLEGVTVVFTPEGGRPATGTTDGSGKFTLSTFRPGDGAVPGRHKVSIRPKAGASPPPMPGSPEAKQAQPEKPPFPAKYSDPNQSGLTAEVKSGQANEFKFDLTD